MMRLHAKIPIPSTSTIAEIEQVVEFLTGVGYAAANYKARMIAFEWEASDSPPSEVTQLVVDSAMGELEPLLAAMVDATALRESDVRHVFELALGVGERWQEVVDELRTYGWDEPELLRPPAEGPPQDDFAAALDAHAAQGRRS